MSDKDLEYFVFEKYIETEANNFAKKVCMRIAEGMDSKYSPLLICGETGTGKTHLVKSIEAYVKEHDSEKNVVYVDADTFTEEIIQSMQIAASMKQKFFKYRHADIFIFDGLEKIQKRDATKEELIDIIQYLQESYNKTIVLTSSLGLEQLFNDHVGLKRIVEESYLVRIERQETIIIDYYVDQELLRDYTLSNNILWFIKRNCEARASKAKGMINTIKMWMDIYGKEPSDNELRTIFNISNELQIFNKKRY